MAWQAPRSRVRQFSDVDLRADLDDLGQRDSETPLVVDRVAVHIGKDRLGNAIEFGLVLHHDRLVADVISGVGGIEGDAEFGGRGV